MRDSELSPVSRWERSEQNDCACDRDIRHKQNGRQSRSFLYRAWKVLRAPLDYRIFKLLLLSLISHPTPTSTSTHSTSPHNGARWLRPNRPQPPSRKRLDTFDNVVRLRLLGDRIFLVWREHASLPARDLPAGDVFACIQVRSNNARLH